MVRDGENGRVHDGRRNPRHSIWKRRQMTAAPDGEGKHASAGAFFGFALRRGTSEDVGTLVSGSVQARDHLEAKGGRGRFDFHKATALHEKAIKRKIS